MARRTKAEAEQTREAILDAAELVFASRGVGASTLEDIAKAAGVTRGAVYWHFKDKAEIFDAMHRRVKLPLDRFMEDALAGDDILQGLRDSCVFALKQIATDIRMQRVFGILMFRCELAAADACRNDRYKMEKRAVTQKFERSFARAKKQGLLAADISPRLAASALSSFIGGLFNAYLRDPEQFNLKRDAVKLVDVFFRGLLA